jgi:hypothetical protein
MSGYPKLKIPQKIDNILVTKVSCGNDSESDGNGGSAAVAVAAAGGMGRQRQGWGGMMMKMAGSAAY